MIQAQKKNDFFNEKVIQARVFYYDFFAGLFLFELLKDRTDLLKKQIQILKNIPIDEDDLKYFEFLEKEFLENGTENIISEFNQLFSLPFSQNGFKPVYLYLSHYQENCIGGNSLLVAKEIIKKSGYYLNKDKTKESEENLGVLFLVMRFLLDNKDYEISTELFIKCIKPMKDLIIENIALRKDCPLFGNINSILKSFLILEESIYSS